MTKASLINRLKFKIFKNHYRLLASNLVVLPLIFPEKKLCLFFSAKSGCTFATKWFFFQLGLLNEALDYHHWVHNYRIDIYYKQKEYLANLNSVLSPDYLRIKLVRSPYQRAVSSYIHAIRTRYATEDLSRFLQRDVSDEKKFTFEEFIDYLEATGVKNCNPHHRVQLENLEADGLLQFDKIIKLEESFPAFLQLEQELGLKSSDLGSFAQSQHHRNRDASDEYCGNKLYKRSDQTFGQFRAFYNDSLKEKIANLYMCDFEQYHYPLGEI